MKKKISRKQKGIRRKRGEEKQNKRGTKEKGEGKKIIARYSY